MTNSARIFAVLNRLTPPAAAPETNGTARSFGSNLPLASPRLATSSRRRIAKRVVSADFLPPNRHFGARERARTLEP